MTTMTTPPITIPSVSIRLAERLKKPTEKDFHYKATMTGLQECGPEKADLTLRLRYFTRRQISDALSSSMTRRALTKGGIKAMLVEEEESKAELARAGLAGWTMNVRAAYSLAFEGDLDAAKPDDIIEDTPENRRHMFAESTLVTVVNSLLQDHTKWYKRPGGDEDVTADDEEEDGVPNSPSGR